MNEITLPLDIGFEIRALEAGSRARYHSVTEAPQNIESLKESGGDFFFFLNLEGQSEDSISDFPSRQL